MISTCEKCKTRFKLDETQLKVTGSKVRCPKCKDVFIAYPPSSSPGQADAKAMPKSPPVKKAQEDDFDISDIEKALSADVSPKKNKEAAEDLSFELDLDMGLDEASKAPSEKENDMSFDLDLDMDLLGGSEKPKGEDLSDLDDLFGDDSKSAAPKPEKPKTEKIPEDLSLLPDPGSNAPEADVEFEETDEFAKYGTLEFNVKDMYKTLGIEMDSGADAEAKKAEMAGDKKEPVSEQPADLDLSDLDEMLGIDEEQPPAKPKKDTEPDDDIEFDLSGLDDALENGKQSSSAAVAIEDDQGSYGSATEVFDINSVLDGDASKAVKEGKKESQIRDLDENEDMDLELDLEEEKSSAKAEEPELDLSLDLDEPQSEKAEEEDFDLSLELEDEKPSA